MAKSAIRTGETRLIAFMAFFGPGMGLVIDIRQSLKIQMGVDLGGGQIGVPQQLLHRAQVGRGFQQMGGKAVPQLVRIDVGSQILLDAPLLQP